MNQRERYGYAVLFTQGPRLGDLFEGRGWKERWRIIRRHPKVCYQLWGSWLSGKLTGSGHRHCLPSDSEQAMDFGFCKIQFVPMDRFDRRHHNLMGWVYFESPMKPDWDQYKNMKSGLWYATFGRILMWMTRGWFQCRNCTTITRHWLQCLGVPVPRKCWNPKLLLLWMTENGFTYASGYATNDIESVD